MNKEQILDWVDFLLTELEYNVSGLVACNLFVMIVILCIGYYVVPKLNHKPWSEKIAKFYKIYIAFTILAFCFFVFLGIREYNNRALVKISELNCAEKGKIVVCLNKDNTPYTGFVFKKYKNGNMHYKRQYKDGVLNGTSLLYYENGNVNEKSSWLNGQMHGRYKTYDENGHLTVEVIFENGFVLNQMKKQK